MSDQIDGRLVESITLVVFETGTNAVNYQIMHLLPCSVSEIMTELDLTKVPVNNRLNQLEKCGLVERYRGTGKVHVTPFGYKFVESVQWLMSLVEDDKKDFVNRFVCMG